MRKEGFLLDDSRLYEPIFGKACEYCVYYKKGRKCKAFDHIPDEIWSGKNKHKTAVDGDKGIRFKSFGDD